MLSHLTALFSCALAMTPSRLLIRSMLPLNPLSKAIPSPSQPSFSAKTISSFSLLATADKFVFGMYPPSNAYALGRDMKAR